MNLYSIFDHKMEQYLPPFAAHNNAHAIRMFADHVNERGTPVNKHPEDYTLDHVGTFDETTGLITGGAIRIAKAIDFHQEQLEKTETDYARTKALDITNALKRKEKTA